MHKWDRQSCKPQNDTTLICPLTAPIEYGVACEVELFKGSSDSPNNCQVSESKLADSCIRLADNEWIHSIDINEQVKIIN